MPHVTIEYTSNIAEGNQIKSLFQPLHRLIVEKLEAKIEHCKTKAIKIDNYLNSDGDSGFVMVVLVLKKGRTPEMIEIAAREIMLLLKNFFAQSIADNQAVVTLEIRDLSVNYYKG